MTKKRTKADTLFMTKTGEGATHTYIGHIKGYPHQLNVLTNYNIIVYLAKCTLTVQGNDTYCMMYDVMAVLLHCPITSIVCALF